MSAALTDAEFDRIETLLEAHPESLTLDALQGFCAAVASAPAPMSADKWHVLALGGETPDAELAGLLDRLYAETQAHLASGEAFPFLVYGLEDEPDRADYQGWCAGYVHGFTQTPGEVLDEAADSDDIDDAFHPIALLSGVLKESLEGTDEWLNEEEEAEAMAEAEEELGNAVRALYQLFHRA